LRTCNSQGGLLSWVPTSEPQEPLAVLFAWHTKG
jgi:hypothetical protein